MESRSPLAAKRRWSYLRVVFFMLRKRLISKRKLVMDMSLMMKRGKLISKGLGNLVFQHHHQHKRRRRPHDHDFGLKEYELSCDSSPNLVFFHSKRPRRSYFPCMGAVVEDDDEPPPPIPSTIIASFPGIHCSTQWDLPSYSPSPSPINVSDCDVEEEAVSHDASPESNAVDNEAEAFIRRFYEQLHRQSHIALLQYELDYQEMMSRSS